MHRLPFPTGRIRAKEVGELIHSDVCGPMQETSLSGARYYVLFKDDCSGWRVVHFLKNKSEVATNFKLYAARLETETGKTVKTLRSDNGGEYRGE